MTMTLHPRSIVFTIVWATLVSFTLSFHAQVHPPLRLKARNPSSTPSVLYVSRSHKELDVSLDASTLACSEEISGSGASMSSSLASTNFDKEGDVELLSPVWKARLLLLLCAALYGTNYTSIKIVDEHIPVAIATATRFGLASCITLPWLFQNTDTSNENDNFHTWSGLTPEIIQKYYLFI